MDIYQTSEGIIILDNQTRTIIPQYQEKPITKSLDREVPKNSDRKIPHGLATIIEPAWD
jgi:hypothetical protein